MQPLVIENVDYYNFVYVFFLYATHSICVRCLQVDIGMMMLADGMLQVVVVVL